MVIQRGHKKPISENIRMIRPLIYSQLGGQHWLKNFTSTIMIISFATDQETIQNFNGTASNDKLTKLTVTWSE